MPVSTSNLISGAGTLYTGTFGATEPATVATAPGVGWTDVGGTQDGVKIKISQKWMDFEVDQIVDTPERRLTDRDMTVSTSLAEATIANLTLALNSGTVTTTAGVSTTYTPVTGLGVTQPTYSALLFDGYAPGGFKRRVTVRKALQTDDVEISYTKKDQTLIPVSFQMHYVSSAIAPFTVTDALA